MPRHNRRDPMFRYRRHEEDVIVLAVRWYISYRLSLRDSVEMLGDRGLDVHPSTIWRWVQTFVPEFAKRWSRLLKPVGTSWRVGEAKRSCAARPPAGGRVLDQPNGVSGGHGPPARGKRRD